MNRLQAGICNLRVTGVLRVELQPLVGIMPLVGAASVAFVKDPVSWKSGIKLARITVRFRAFANSASACKYLCLKIVLCY